MAVPALSKFFADLRTMLAIDEPLLCGCSDSFVSPECSCDIVDSAA